MRKLNINKVPSKRYFFGAFPVLFFSCLFAIIYASDITNGPAISALAKLFKKK